MNLIDNKRELDEAVLVLSPVYENSGFHITAVTASTEEYPTLKTYAFGDRAEFLAIDTGYERVLVNVTRCGKSFTIDVGLQVYCTLATNFKHTIGKNALNAFRQYVVKSKTATNQICAEAFDA